MFFCSMTIDHYVIFQPKAREKNFYRYNFCMGQISNIIRARNRSMYITQTKQSDVISFAAGGHCEVLMDKDFVHLDLPPGEENKEV